MNMYSIEFPQMATVSEKNKSYVDYFVEKLGHVPNMFAVMMHSQNALNAYYPYHLAKTSLSKREVEAITLVVSQHNLSKYCLSAHTMIGKLNGFSDMEIMELRGGTASFDAKLNALVSLIKRIVEWQQTIEEDLLKSFFTAGYTRGSLIDALNVVRDNFITNLTAKTLHIPIDFPLAEDIQTQKNER